jgi:hypothetical protein
VPLIVVVAPGDPNSPVTSCAADQLAAHINTTPKLAAAIADLVFMSVSF